MLPSRVQRTKNGIDLVNLSSSSIIFYKDQILKLPLDGLHLNLSSLKWQERNLVLK